jgi:exodeoxyribonuclease V gamma subunit
VDEPALAANRDASADEPGLAPLTLQDLAAFLRNPVKAFFRHRLRVFFAEPDAAQADDESFGGDGLERWSWVDDLLRASRAALEDEAAAVAPEHIQNVLRHQLTRLQRAGGLPLAGPGQQMQAALMQALCPTLAAWQALRAEYPLAPDRLALRLAHPQQPGLVLDDTLTALRGSAQGRPAWVELQASKLADPGGKTGPALPRVDKLLLAWLRCLASSAIGRPTDGVVIGEGAVVRVTATPDAEAARKILFDLMLACHAGLTGDRPLPTAVKTGYAFLERSDRAAEVYDGDAAGHRHGEGQEPCLARLFPDFASLAADPAFDAASRRLYAPYREWLAEHVHVELLGVPAAPEVLSEQAADV